MTNEILPFGLGVESNVMAQADYEALAARSGGFSSGVAKSEQLNKVWRQSAFVASVLAQFIANRSAYDVLDDGDTATLLTNLELAVKTYANANLPAASTTTAGITQLSSLTNSNSEVLAATPKAIKTVSDATLKIASNLSEIAAAGPVAVAATLANLDLSDAAHLPQLTGVVGTSRNAKMSVTAASSTATFTADELIVQTALGGLQYKLTSLNKTINLGTTGAGGMDTGTVPAAGFVALYAIYNPSSQASALLAVNTTSVLAPEVCAGIMPSGYTASALISVWRTASSQLVIGYQQGRKIVTQNSVATTSASLPASYIVLSLTGIVPVNAKSTNGWIGITTTSAANNQVFVASSVSGIYEHLMQSAAVVTLNTVLPEIPIITPQVIYYKAASNGAVAQFVIDINGYTF
ncbi:tail fiber protein [Yersinia rohdei]|uniref:phage tail protein n=1 Tax=Yersinia rohdei TaxID=29485 RepID=UPI0005DF3837|nr:phage tail protein [Yersinia rohdei]CNJ30417.1 tail fiber protein [Yersinia rohdei]